MKKIPVYVLTFINLREYGYNPQSCYVFSTYEEAYEKMKEIYLKKCKEMNIDNPMEEDSYDYQISTHFAYIMGEYYWDLFERGVETA